MFKINYKSCLFCVKLVNDNYYSIKYIDFSFSKHYCYNLMFRSSNTNIYFLIIYCLFKNLNLKKKK